MSNYIRTYSGTKIDLFQPDNNLYALEDIAQGLSLTNRYNGQTKRAYSVAEHSILVASMCEPKYQLAGLMHDASEAYMGDMVKPFKNDMPDFRKFEDIIQKSIMKFHDIEINKEIEDHVKNADLFMLTCELVNIWPNYPEDYEKLIEYFSSLSEESFGLSKENFQDYGYPLYLPADQMEWCFLDIFQHIKEGKYIKKPFKSLEDIQYFAAYGYHFF